MRALADVVAALASGLALGGMAFFSFVMAPLVFRRLPFATAAAFIRAAFLRYHLYLAATSAAAAAAAMAAVAGLGLLARQVLVPLANRQRDAELAGDAAAGAAFARTHRPSVAINAAQLLAVVAAQAWGG